MYTVHRHTCRQTVKHINDTAAAAVGGGGNGDDDDDDERFYKEN